METKYKVKDVAYYVNEFRILKMIITEIIITEDVKGVRVNYTIIPYSKSVKQTPRSCVEAFLVADLKTAKESALKNWYKISNEIFEGIHNLTDEMFDTKEEKKVNE